MFKVEDNLIDRLNESMLGIVLNEKVDDRLRKMAKAGLIEKDEMSFFIRVMTKIDKDDVLTVDERVMLIRVFDKLLNLVMADPKIYQKILHKVRETKITEEKNNKSLFETYHTIIERNGKKYYVDEKNKLQPYTNKAIKDFLISNNYIRPE